MMSDAVQIDIQFRSVQYITQKFRYASCIVFRIFDLTSRSQTAYRYRRD